MEAGENDVNQELGKHIFDGHFNISGSSEVFDVVVDPLTDFKVLELNNEPSSPQQSFNLPSTLSRLHSTSSEDANLWSSSDVSLSSDSGSGCARDRAGSCGGGGGSSNHHRLVVPEVHRFGYNPPCAGSPHDLASCPVASISAAQKGRQGERLHAGHRCEIDEKYDALKALSEASSALALTETLIGPLRIPPVSQEVLDKVVSNMEKKTSSLSFIQNGSNPERQQKSFLQSPMKSSGPPLVAVSPAAATIVQMRSSVNSVSDGSYGSRIPLGSLPSVLEPNVHKKSEVNGDMADGKAKPFALLGADYEPGLDRRVSDSNSVMRNGSSVSATPGGSLSTSRVIAVPVGMSDHGPVEIYKEVHPYPAGSITTVVERCSYIGQTQADARPPAGMKKRRKHSQKLKNKKGMEPYLSQSSLASGSSACSSIASDCTIVSNRSSELTPITRSLASSSKASLNDSRSDCGGPVSKPVLSAAILQMRQALESVSNASDNRSDKSSGGLEVASTFSDTSSNLSTLSDLSGYEDEYIRIKRLVSDAVIAPEDYKKLLDKTNAKSPVSKPVPSVDYEKIIRDLHAQKEDLEIQLHRLSIQVQNAVREKELYQQQLELMNTKITETNQKQYFEVLKQRANLEGQLEMLKQELENSVYEKGQLQSKVSELTKDAESSKNEAAEAKESELLKNARLLKYEEANKDLEAKLKKSNDELRNVNNEYAKTRNDLADLSDKNISLEMSLEQQQERESQLTMEIKGYKSRLSSLQEESQTQIQIQHQLEAAASKASSELKAAQNSSQWYQEQLQLSQSARSNTQQELVEARASVAKLTSEKESLDVKVQTLVREAEDGQARAVREKASLVAHLEALQADMAEREALVSQMERDRGNDTKLMEDRRQRLEQDRHRIHKLRLDLSDTERQLDTLRDDLKHKCLLISKYEKELKDLRTLEAVNQEVLGERDARILNQEQALSENKLLLNNAQQDLKQKLLDIAALKEEKSILEVSFTAANNEKREVDDAIVKVREDMTKLSSNFYRMKHDLAVKDRQVEVCKKEAESLRQLKDTLEKKYEALEAKMKDDVENKKLMQELVSLKKENKELMKDKEASNGEVAEIKRSLKTIEIEKKGLNEAVRLREEQIQNMQASLENYREAILKKDEELYVRHEQSSSVEKSYAELRRNWEALKEDNMALRQEAEAYSEHERGQRRELSDLKESIQKERKFKQSLEKKMEKSVKAQEEMQARMEGENSELEKRSKDLSRELNSAKEEKEKLADFLENLKKEYMDLCREIETVKDEKTKLESQLNEAVSELEVSKQGSSNSAGMVKVLESRMEVLLKENSDLTNRLATIQTNLQAKVAELENVLRLKTKELSDVKGLLAERDTLISKFKLEKGQASDQLGNVLAENARLKKSLSAIEEIQNKESRTNVEHRDPVSKKQGRNYDNLQKELSVIQAKYQESEAKIKEITKQKENLQATMKNTKKESLLMKAKMKELESLKAKCKELETSKVSSQDLQTFEIKCSEIESKLKLEEEKVTSLEASLTEKGQLILELEQREKEMVLQIEVLLDEKRNLQLKVTTLEQVCQKSQDEVDQYQLQLKVAENDRDEWMVKYESLRDIIPERDTSTQRAVQLGVTDSSQVMSNNQEAVVVPPLDGSSSLNLTRADIGFLSDMSQATIANGSQFDKTMADLQAQVSLTSKALQNKEKQICDLQHQLGLRHLADCNESSSPGGNSQDALSYGGETVPLQVHKQEIESLLEKIKQLQVVQDRGTTAQKEAATSKEGADAEEVQLLLSKVKGLESSLGSKEDEIDKARARVSEFQEKHRRYESNVRLLTRKLKEHMKGRKSAEKEIQLQAEDHQRLMNEEHQRYSVLRCRYMELEGRCESLEGQTGGLESEVEEVRSALNTARQEAQDHHQNTLSLQKEIGRLQEHSKMADSLRSELKKSEEKVTEKEGRIKELEKDLQVLSGQLKESQTTTDTLNLMLEQQQTEITRFQNQLNDSEAKVLDLRQQVKNKEEESCKISQSLKDMEASKQEAEEKIIEAEGNKKLLSAEIQRLKEEHFRITSECQLTKVQLQESIAKNSALESQIKVVEGELGVVREETVLAKERQVNLNASHQAKVRQLEESISRSQQEVVTLSTQLGQVQKERVSYQTQATELRTALHSALAQLKTFKADEEAREAIQTEVGIIPSPSPLDLTSLAELMERSVRPVRPEVPLSSLQSCLSSLKAEVATLQTQLQTKGKELNDVSGISEISSDGMVATNPGRSSKASSGTEIV